MNESVSATPPTKLDIITDNIYTTDGTPQHMRSVTTNTNNTTIINTPRTPTDVRLYHPSMIRTASIDNSNNASKSMTIVVQNPFEDSIRHIDDPSNDPSGATKYLLHSPSPSKQHNIGNVQSPRTISRTPTPGTPHQTPDDVSMTSPSMSTNLQRHPSQQTRPPLSTQTSNNGTLTNISMARNIVPQQQTQSSQHHVRFNQDLLNNYGINVPMTRQTSQPGTNETSSTSSPSNSPSVTSLIPLPSPLPNNLGVNMHHMNQASITPTILGGFPIHQSSSQSTGTNNNFISPQQTNVQNKSDNHHNISSHGSHHPLSTSTHHTPTGIYVNTRQMLSSPVTTVTGIGKVKQQLPPPPPPQQQLQPQPIRPGMPTNGTPTGPSTVVLRYPPMIQTPQQTQQHAYQMMKPRMIPPNAFGSRGAPPPQPPPPPPQLIMQPITMQQSAQIIYDPNTLYRTPGQQQQPPPPPPQVQQQINSLQTNPHMNDSLINQQKHQHQQSIPQQVLHLPSGMLTTDDNILKSLLQINPQANSEEIAAIKARTNNNTMSNGISTDSNDPYDNSQMNIHDNSTHNYSNSHHHLYNPSLNTQTHSNNSTGTTVPNIKIPKSRKKRKPNDLNTSFEDDVPTKPRKRKKKGTEETEKFVEHSLQQLRDLPMLTPLEPSIDINNDLSLSLPFDLPDKKYQYQGEFGNVFIENISDHYRPYRKPPVKPISSIISSNSLSMLERRYRLCSTLLDHPPNLPSPPLTVDSNDKLSELLIKEQNNDIRDDESIISTSTLADDDHIINNMETENIQLLKTLSSNNDLRSLSPVLISNDILTTKNSESLLAPSATTTTATSTVDIKKEINDTPVTSAPPGGNELEKKDRPIVEGTDKVSVTLTLTTEAANNVQSVIAAVADLLKIAYPSTFDVHQTINNNSNVHYSSSFDQNCSCSTTLNNNNSNNFLSSSTIPQISTISRSLSTYKIGRETSVSIQSLIEMQPKYCRNCTQRLPTDTIFKKRLTELPSAIRELIPNSEPFVYFCNEQCFNNCVSTTHNQQQTLTINTSINNSPIIKNESMDTTSPPCTPNDLNGSPNGRSRRLSLKRRQDSLNKSNGDKRWKDIRWKRWDPSITLKTVIRPSNTQEIEQLISDMKIPLSQNAKQDKRICAFCNGIGDMTTNGPGRLLNLDVGQWCHLNCALWSTEVYETVSGALMCVEQAYKRSINTECASCKQKGASLTCFFQRCPNTYHFPCAVNNGCVFYKNKTIMCPVHASRTTAIDQILEDKSVFRKVWINRDEVKQIQSYMTEEHEETSYTLRIGSLILHNIGQLLPHQLQSAVFHNRNFIYPVGYNVTRFYWSMRRPNRRCAYNCSIIDINNKPMFRIRIQENEDEPAQEFLESTAKLVWHKIVDEIDSLRRQHGLVKMFSVFVSGEDLYGLTEPHIIRLIESLPGVEMLQNYAFKYGRLQLLDMPLTLNPTGCARSEPKLQTHFRRHAQTLTSSHSTRSALPRTVLGVEGTQIPYVKHFVLSKSTQYRKLKTEWRQNVFLAKSRIQGLGLFAGRDLEKHTMVIEYIGELIRNEVANKREKLYEQQNRGIYMFRLDEEYVVDATMSGCLARYINHSCEPNSIAEVVQIEKDSKIIIITNRRIAKGEEIMYDYKFDFEEDSKIPCLCGAANCRKWMN